MAEEKNVMQNIDIKDFRVVQTLNDGDYVVASLVDGLSGRVKVALLKALLTERISPNIKDGMWYVGDKNLGIEAEGKTPMFRKGALGIEYKYTSEDNSAWQLLVPIDDLYFDIDDLTQDQLDLISLKFEDLTEENIAELQKPANEMISVLEKTNKNIQDAEEIRKNSENTRITNENTRKSEESLRVTAENARKASEDERNTHEQTRRTYEDSRRTAEVQREIVKNEMVALNQELKAHPPIIDSTTYNWKIWDAVNKTYVDTGITGQGRTPIIIEGVWWIWDDNKDEYVSTGYSVNSDYVLTKENVIGVLGNVPMMFTEWNHKKTPYGKGTFVKFNQEFFVALTDTEIAPVPLVLLEDGSIAKLNEHTYATQGTYDAVGNKEDWKKIPYDQLRLVSREGTLNGNLVDVRNLSGEEVYQFEPNLEIDFLKGEIKGVGVLKMNNDNVIYI